MKPCAREESEQRTRLHRKQRSAVILLFFVFVVVVVVVPLFIDEGCARQRSVPLLTSMHLPRAEREPSKLSPGRMLPHIQNTEGERERKRGERRGGTFSLPPPSNIDYINPSYPKKFIHTERKKTAERGVRRDGRTGCLSCL